MEGYNLKKVKRLLIFGLALLLVCCSKTPSKVEKEQTGTKSEEAIERDKKTTDNSDSSFPMTIVNNGREIVFENSPKRPVALTYPSATIFAALGISNHLVGLAEGMYNLEDVKEEYRDALKDIPVLKAGKNENTGVAPSFETVLELNPDFAMGNVYSFMAKNIADQKDFDANHIKTYCSGDKSIKDVYADIENIGKIFGVSDKAQQLIAELQQREENIKSKIKDKQPLGAIMYDCFGTDPFVAGGSSYQGILLEEAGARNLFGDTQGLWVKTSWEALIDKNPDVIFVPDYASSVVPIDEKISFLKNKEEIKNVNAIKNDRIVIVKFIDLDPGIQNFDVLEYMAKSLYPDDF
ncbi:periplasmic binding protein [Peptostreptococcaceae bacterium oral taxon 113 str. W5053]|nr:periplasmic binding protein [Peptostreptococcaceae bacterium oral taxon 113 str. W5053]